MSKTTGKKGCGMMKKMNITKSYLFKLRDSLGIINAIIEPEHRNITIHELTTFVQSEIERRFLDEQNT